MNREPSSPEIFGLFVDYPNGKTSFLSFSTAFDRGLMVIALSNQPVNLRPVTYR